MATIKSTSTNTTASSATATSSNTATAPQASTPLAGFALWVAGWVLLITVIYLLSRSRAGQAIVYYVLWLSITLVLVTHADSITTLFQQANIFQGQY